MAGSAEHQFVSTEFDLVLQRFSATGLIGISEAERRKFDYACILYRDFSRPLVAQVLWSHEEGIDKDIRILLHDKSASLKIYFVRDSVRNRLRIDEVLQAYRENEVTSKFLVGLKLIFLPPEFDADKLDHQTFMARYLEDVVVRDLLFSVIFGQLNSHELRIFAEHGGPLGLKYIILDEISHNGLIHTPTFKSQIGYSSNSTIREATTMLAASGLVNRVSGSNILLPSFKGRLLLDLTRLLLIEYQSQSSWSPQVELILRHLNVPVELLSTDEINGTISASRILPRLLQSALWCESQFGRSLLHEVNLTKPILYSEFNWRDFYERIRFGPNITPEWFNDEQALFFVDT